MTEQLLHRPNIGSPLEQMRRKRVAQRVARRALRDASATNRIVKRALTKCCMEVVPNARAIGVDRCTPRGEQVLPAPLAGGIRVLALERVGKAGRVNLRTLIVPELIPTLRHEALHHRNARLGEWDSTVLVAL